MAHSQRVNSCHHTELLQGVATAHYLLCTAVPGTWCPWSPQSRTSCGCWHHQSLHHSWKQRERVCDRERGLSKITTVWYLSSTRTRSLSEAIKFPNYFYAHACTHKHTHTHTYTQTHTQTHTHKHTHTDAKRILMTIARQIHRSTSSVWVGETSRRV